MISRRLQSLMLGVAVVASAAGCSSSDDEKADDACSKQRSGVVCTIAGSGVAGDGLDLQPALETQLYSPADMAVSPKGLLHIADWNNHHIRALQPDGTLKIVAGPFGELAPETGTDEDLDTRLNHPTDITFDAAGRLVIAAWHNSRVKVVEPETGELTDICGNGDRGFSGDGGPATEATLNLPVSVVFNEAGELIISDSSNERIRKVDLEGIITTIAGTGDTGFGGDGGPSSEATFSWPVGQASHPAGHLAFDARGRLFVADTGNNRIRMIDTDGVITTVVGTGEQGYSGNGIDALEAELNQPVDIAFGLEGELYIADTGNNCIRVVRDGVIEDAIGTCGSCSGSESFACTCGPGDPACIRDGGEPLDALLRHPFGVAVGPEGNIYVADSLHHRIRVVRR